MDLGSVAVDSKDVVVPTSESIFAFKVELTKAGERCQILVDTTERAGINIGNSTDEDKAVWDLWEVAHATPQVQAFLAGVRGRVAAKPLKLSLTREVVGG